MITLTNLLSLDSVAYICTMRMSLNPNIRLIKLISSLQLHSRVALKPNQTKILLISFLLLSHSLTHTHSAHSTCWNCVGEAKINE